jgi:hypothetical protein
MIFFRNRLFRRRRPMLHSPLRDFVSDPLSHFRIPTIRESCGIRGVD